MTTAAMVPRPQAGAKLPDVLAYQDHLIAAQQYEYLGRMKMVVLEASKGANVPGIAETSIVGVRLDWCNEPNPNGKGYLDNFIPIAQSLDHSMLLILGAVRRRDGRVGLPDIPDPAWKSKAPAPEEIDPIIGKDEKGRPIYGPSWTPTDPPRIAQPLEQRARGKIGGTEILVLGPVHQIMFQPDIGEQGLQPTYWSIAGRAADGSTWDPGTNSHLELLIDRVTGAAHFFGGQWQIIPVG
jgi:hypothetical protein